MRSQTMMIPPEHEFALNSMNNDPFSLPQNNFFGNTDLMPIMNEKDNDFEMEFNYPMRSISDVGYHKFGTMCHNNNLIGMNCD